MNDKKYPRLFGDILPYEAEVAEPDGERIVAWILADYGRRCQQKFEAWLDKWTAQQRAEALTEAADDMEQRINDPDLILMADQYKGFHAGERYRGQREIDILRAKAAMLRELRPDRKTGPKTTHHNHRTRDIKPYGECPACDRLHEKSKLD